MVEESPFSVTSEVGPDIPLTFLFWDSYPMYVYQPRKLQPQFPLPLQYPKNESERFITATVINFYPYYPRSQVPFLVTRVKIRTTEFSGSRSHFYQQLQRCLLRREQIQKPEELSCDSRTDTARVQVEILPRRRSRQ